jgi:hypothetical protein
MKDENMSKTKTSSTRSVSSQKTLIDEAEANRKWVAFVNDLVPHEADTIEWYRPESIVTVVNRIAQEVPGGHWAFVPTEDPLEITGASMGSERDLIRLEIEGGRSYECCPSSLLCAAFWEAPEWSYFDLKLRGIASQAHTPVLRGHLVMFSKGSPYSRECRIDDSEVALLGGDQFWGHIERVHVHGTNPPDLLAWEGTWQMSCRTSSVNRRRKPRSSR